MNEKTIAKNDLKKSLEFLESISKAKGTQLTQGRQKRPVHPNPEEQPIETDDSTDWEDGMDEEGVDYKHMDELEFSTASGEDTPADTDHDTYEGDFMAAKRGKKPKGSVAKSMKHEDEAEDKKLVKEMMDKKKGDYKKACKSAVAMVDPDNDEELRKGYEVSKLLAHQGLALHKSMEALAKGFIQGIEEKQAEQHQVNAGMAKAMTVLHKSLQEIMDRLETVEGQPTEPKSVDVKPVSKSFSPDGTPEEEDVLKSMSKPQVMDKLWKGFEAGDVDGKDIQKLEITNILSSAAEAYLRKQA